jgi:hypothetical protein
MADDQELKIFLYCNEDWALFNTNNDNKTEMLRLEHKLLSNMSLWTRWLVKTGKWKTLQNVNSVYPFWRTKSKYYQLFYIICHRHKSMAPRIHGIHTFTFFFRKYNVQHCVIHHWPQYNPTVSLCTYMEKKFQCSKWCRVPFQSVHNEADTMLRINP